MKQISQTPISQRYEEAEDHGANGSANPTMGDVIAERLSRRDLMKGALAVTAINALLPLDVIGAGRAAVQTASAMPSFVFQEVAAGSDENHHVAEGYEAEILIRWGDKVLAGAPDFDPQHQTAEAQAQQFGYNNDFLGFIPLGEGGNRGLLVVNHEYTNVELIFPGGGAMNQEHDFAGMTKALVEIEMMAHGGSVLEIERQNGRWRVVEGSPHARRITTETEMRISGPAAGADKMKTSYDPAGTKVRGMLNNCAGGVTPWGTWLTCEENFNGYFWGKKAAAESAEAEALKRYGAPGEWYAWGRHYDRFDYAKEPNELNRFGWVVEIDPFDANSTPVKRTAMGRFKHEGAANVIN
jgi:secreted PhoX family phosphatase